MTHRDDTELLSLLAELEANEPAREELHCLDVMFRHRGPAREGVVELVARLLRVSEAVPAGARGSMEQRLMELEAGPCAILLELRPRPGATSVDVHGQVVAEGVNVAGGTVVFSWEEDGAISGRLDEFGEFDLRDVPAGVCRASWQVEDTRIVLPELRTDGPGDMSRV